MDLEGRARLRALLSAAFLTPHPWTTEGSHSSVVHVAGDARTRAAVVDSDANGALIVAARNALPALLDALDAAEERAERLLSERDDDCSHGAHGPWCREWEAMRARADAAEADVDSLLARSDADDAAVVRLAVSHDRVSVERDAAIARAEAAARERDEAREAARHADEDHVHDVHVLTVERDEALAKLARVTAQRDRLREVMETVGEEWVSHSQACTDAAKAWGERNGTDADYPPCTCGLDAALTEEP